jgi:ATP-dependent Clp protease ATP-binding subunit ClpA
MEITVYNGSLKGFRAYIQKEGVNHFDLFLAEIHKLDNLKAKTSMYHFNLNADSTDEEISKVKKIEEKLFDNQAKSNENLVVFSNNYSSFNEHVIFNIKWYLDNLLHKNVYFHNPPKSLFEIINSEYTKVIMVEESYDFLNKEEFLCLENTLKATIIGQDRALDRVLNNLVLNLNSKISKPIVLLFCGSSGIGKTQTAQSLATITNKQLFRKQMSMAHSLESQSYFFGGKFNEKSFAKDLIERESNIILLDEFDKVNPIFYNVFYQLFDEGKFVDTNYSMNLNNSIIICTSNYKNEKQARKELGEAIFSRFNDVIEFKDLSVNIIRELINKEIKQEYDKLILYVSNIDINLIQSKFDSFDDKKISTLNNVRTIKKFVKYLFSTEVRKNIYVTEQIVTLKVN